MMMTQRTKKSTVPDVGTYYVRVLGTRLNKFVEFEFAINDPDLLMVELIMPFEAFDEFCEKYHVVVLPPRDDGDQDSDRPGLYRRPEAATGYGADDDTITTASNGDTQ